MCTRDPGPSAEGWVHQLSTLITVNTPPVPVSLPIPAAREDAGGECDGGEDKGEAEGGGDNKGVSYGQLAPTSWFPLKDSTCVALHGMP